MSDATTSRPGEFAWHELGTSDVAGAKAFYGELLGWEFLDHAMSGDMGGAVRVPPCDVPGVGRFAVIPDPQGAVLAVIARAAAE